MAKQGWKEKQEQAAQDQVDAIVASLQEVLDGKTESPAWVKPWADGGFWPRNAVSGREYNGSNVFYLMAIASLKGWKRNRWLTPNQAKKIGREQGRVSFKGQKTVPVVHWSPVFKDDPKTGERTMAFWRCKVWRVFNVEQVSGLPEAILDGPKVEPLPESDRDAQAEGFFSALGATVEHGGGRAFYSKASDSIGMPDFSTFQDAASYYSTLGHEHVHWTGHESRVSRDLANRFGSEAYAAEELVAEFGAAMLCGALQIDGRLQHPEYIGHWIKVLQNDRRALFTAASKAKGAYRWLLKAGGLAPDDDEGKGEE